jgi:hypothetical protein
MAMTRCPSCGKKVDTSFYGACLDCGILLSTGEDGTTAPEPGRAAPIPAPDIDQAELAPVPVEEHIARHAPELGNEPAPTASPGRGRGVAVGLVVRLVIAAAVIGGGAIWGLVFSADRDESGAIVEAGSLTPDELRIGDCLDWPGIDSGEIESFDSVEARPCDEPHELEVYLHRPFPADARAPYPGDDAILDLGVDYCYESFAGYVGAPYEVVPDLDFTLFWPTEESWEAGDRDVQCLLVHIDEGVKLRGSMAGRNSS